MSIEEGTEVAEPGPGEVGEDTESSSAERRAGRPVVAGRYRIGRRIGKGGMGEVMAARDEQVGRDVAIKRMRAAAPSERAVRRFLREASIQGRLEHPAIVPVHEIGRDSDGLPFFVMKKLTGITLGRVIADPALRERFPLSRVLGAFAEVCLAIELAHVRGIVHRDLKPDNILLGDFGEVYILDWGVAKLIGEDDGEFADVSSSGSGEHATAVGTTIGTAGYMSPEQACGMPDIDGRTDIYALGCVLFEILAGEPLHPRGVAGMQSALAGPDARPSQRAPDRGVPPELDALCVAATTIDRKHRIQSARDLGAGVRRFLDGDRDLARRRALAHDHFARAQAAFTTAIGDGGDESRRTAMREAAAALALDPALDGAAGLVGRLMLEPPRKTPPEVETAILDDEVRTVRANARAGLWALVACLGFMPLLWWISPPDHTYVFAFGGALVVSGLIYLFAYHAGVVRPGVVIVGNVLMLAMLARMFTPIFVAPGVAAVLSLALVVTPQLSILGSPVVVSGLYVAATVVPLALERLDVLDRTVSIDAAGILLRAPSVGGNEGAALAVCVLYMAGLIIGTCWMAHAMRTRTRDAHRHLHLQAWQLRQLVPR
ncbi:MAG TPA: serine/threonine-protein kinase [Kofleriaceae bacterium]|nr:serine/threonine-protein kinase [Kofleriaceae bacterium]